MENKRNSVTIERKQFLLFCGIVGIFISIAFLTQPVNCFPFDGWFHSRHLIFGRFGPGVENRSPIAAPAILYKLNNIFLHVFNLYNPELEFYSAAFLHHCLLFVSAVIFYRIGTLLNLGRFHVFSCVFYVVLIESTMLPQSFWSENTALPLVIAVLYLSVKIYKEQGGASATRLNTTVVLLGLTLGLLILTRTSPVVILATVWVLLAHSPMERARKVRCWVTVTAICLGMLVMLMVSNLWRFGRFEYTSSIGGRLWNSIHQHTEEMLGDTPGYQKLRDHFEVQELQALDWDLRPLLKQSTDVEFKQYSADGIKFHKFLQPMVFKGIADRPLRFSRIGAEKSLQTLNLLQIRRIGTWRGTLDTLERNPLNRQHWLEPVIRKNVSAQLKCAEKIFYGADWVLMSVFNPLLSLVLALVVVLFYQALRSSLFAGAPARIRFLRIVHAQIAEYYPVLLFLLCSFAGYHYLTNMVEHYTDRYFFTVLPVSILLTSILVRMGVLISRKILE